MTNAILRALQVLTAPGHVVEVRAITDDGIASGYFDDPALLAGSAEALDSLPSVQGIYVTLNEVNPALLSRRANRVKHRLGKKDATTADSDILRRRWFPIDIDPTRPSGVSSTDKEHQAAIDTAERIASHLGRLGWPAPVIADSGNGAHLLYRIDLPNDDNSRDLVRRSLEVLATLFDDPTTTIDTANHNAARIWKLYGTMSRKGDHTPDRPHRRSRLLSVPEPIPLVPIILIEALSGTLPETPLPGKKHSHGIDLSTWLHAHGIGIAREKPYGGGTLYVLDECPFSDAHRDGAFAIQFGNGAIHAGCQHTSCGGGAQRWKEFKDQYEAAKTGNNPEKRRAPTAIPPTHTYGEPLTPGTNAIKGTPGSKYPGSLSLDEIPFQNEALDVLQYGNPKELMLQTFALEHEGDEVPAECMILSLASRSVANTNGLHVSVTGESGKGKSHTFTTLLQQVPERLRLAGRMSNKALFYIEKLQPGSVIVFDDTTLSEDMAEILKGVTTSFREPFLYRTVSKDRKGQTCSIPERCVWWVAKVEGAGDDQVFNRMLTCWIDESKEQDERVLARILARDQTPPDDREQERPEILTCQALWEIVGNQMFHVIIPFASRIRFLAHENRRNPEMLLDLIKANTVLRFMQREQTTHSHLSCLTATHDDFLEAVRLYGQLNGIAGGQETKLTRKESDLIAVLSRNNWEEFTIPQLQKQTGLSNSFLHRILHGYESRGARYTGLLEKCPAISFCDRTVVTEGEEGGLSMRRRTNAYTFDQALFRSWSPGGAVWLDDQDDPDNPAAPRQSFSSPRHPAAGLKNDPAASNPDNTSYNKNIVLQSDQSCSKSQDSQKNVPKGSEGEHHAGEPHHAEMMKDTIEKTTSEVPFSNPTRNGGPSCPSADHIPDEGQQQCCRDASNPASPAPHPSIKATDYKPLEVPDHTFCRLCGSPWTHYVEMLTEERKLRRKDQWQPYQICKHCYEKAKRRAQQAATILPGTCDPARMERLTSPFSWCPVCDLDPAIYIDRTTGTKLCETCRQRLSRSPGHGEVSG